MAEHVLRQGRRHLVFVGNPSHPEIFEHRNGFVDALTAHGVKPLRRRRDEFTLASGIDAVHSPATRKVAFDALFACSDLLAVGAIRVVQELGRKVPDDVPVVGYDDMPMAAAFQPALSSVWQDWRAGGSLLAQKMLALLRGEDVASQLLPVRLMVRATQEPVGLWRSSRTFGGARTDFRRFAGPWWLHGSRSGGHRDRTGGCADRPAKVRQAARGSHSPPPARRRCGGRAPG